MSSKPRHIPPVIDFPRGVSLPMGQESSFPEHRYTVSSAPPDCPPQGHIQEHSWNSAGYGNSSGADLSFAFSGRRGDFLASCDTCVEENGQFSPSCDLHNVSWTSSEGDAPIYPLMDSDLENALSQSSPVLFNPFPGEVDMFPAHHAAYAMNSNNLLLPNGAYCAGTFPEEIQAMTNNLHAFQRTPVESFSQPWTHGQQPLRMPQQMPPTPPASDQGTPPSMQECPLPSQDPGQHAYNHPRRQTPRTHNLIESMEDSYPQDMTRWNQIQRLAYFFTPETRN